MIHHIISNIIPLTKRFFFPTILFVSLSLIMVYFVKQQNCEIDQSFQMKNLEVLSSLQKDLIEKHNISSWLCGGVLFGYFAFSDLIPWDSDVDLCVMVEDPSYMIDLNYYEKVLKQDETQKQQQENGEILIKKVSIDKSKEQDTDKPSIYNHRRHRISNFHQEGIHEEETPPKRDTFSIQSPTTQQEITTTKSTTNPQESPQIQGPTLSTKPKLVSKVKTPLLPKLPRLPDSIINKYSLLSHHNSFDYIYQPSYATYDSYYIDVFLYCIDNYGILYRCVRPQDARTKYPVQSVIPLEEIDFKNIKFLIPKDLPYYIRGTYRNELVPRQIVSHSSFRGQIEKFCLRPRSMNLPFLICLTISAAITLFFFRIEFARILNPRTRKQ